jgi:hypothetical protein
MSFRVFSCPPSTPDKLEADPCSALPPARKLVTDHQCPTTLLDRFNARLQTFLSKFPAGNRRRKCPAPTLSLSTPTRLRGTEPCHLHSPRMEAVKSFVVVERSRRCPPFSLARTSLGRQHHRLAFEGVPRSSLTSHLCTGSSRHTTHRCRPRRARILTQEGRLA